MARNRNDEGPLTWSAHLVLCGIMAAGAELRRCAQPVVQRVVSTIDRVGRRRARWPSWGIHCVAGEHERCSMVCGCPHHLDAMRKTTTLELVDSTRSPFEGTGSVWKARVAYDDSGRRICPNDGCGNLLVRVNHFHGRYPRECIDCKRHRVMRGSGS